MFGSRSSCKHRSPPKIEHPKSLHLASFKIKNICQPVMRLSSNPTICGFPISTLIAPSPSNLSHQKATNYCAINQTLQQTTADIMLNEKIIRVTNKLSGSFLFDSSQTIRDLEERKTHKRKNQENGNMAHIAKFAFRIYEETFFCFR